MTLHRPSVPTLDDAPRLDPAGAQRLARDHWGLETIATPLTSERDQNFLLTTAGGDRLVLKIANAREARSMLDAQQRALAHLAPRLGVVPRVVSSLSGVTTVDVGTDEGRRHLVWAITWLPGTPLGSVRRRSAPLLQDLGRAVGTLARSLADFDHDAIHRDFYWDLANGRQVIAERRQSIEDDGIAAAVDTLLHGFARYTAPLLPGLRRSAIHGDLNDFNVLVARGHGAERREQRIVGVVDFGDMVFGYTVADLAIAIAYAVLEASDPLTAAAHVVRGCHTVWPLDEAELGALFGLVALRLCTSACIAAEQVRQHPENVYLGVSQAAIRRTLPRLAHTPFPFAEAVFREACGLAPVAASERVSEWLRENTAAFAPVLHIDVRREPCIVLDLSVRSPLVSGDESENAEPRLTARVLDIMKRAGARVAVGRYDEPRLLYVSPPFAIGDKPTDERRTLHIGLDLFADPGTVVYAPLAGIVYAFADNATPQDYGPVIVLQHATDDGTEFFTLYGHLSRASLAGVRIGQLIDRGQRIAEIGTPGVNGGWTPHLHLQVITDLLGLGCDFPGVGRASQRAVWRSLSPDPNLIVGIPASRFPPVPPAKAETLAVRRNRIGHNVSVAYDDPVKIVRGWRQYLFDDDGRRYLDAYNNVPHVGHCHPRVVDAGRAQMEVLNTNTRYPSDLLNEYAGRLCSTLPEPLSGGVCFFVNSASEANELALRLARAHTRHRDMIVLDGAYHGHTTTLIDLSPYKHAGPGGHGAPRWVHVAPLPDDYRGPYKRDDPDAGQKYAAHVGELIERAGGLAGFVAETCPSVAGQIMLPPGYLRDVYRRVRDAGGVCIADEVQTGLGRMGTHFWAFQAHAVVPDIVVMGKPLGNGHPIGAVVTTPEIAASFDTGMEFFSTFGGNTVSCAIGLAVLDVLRDEELQDNALRVGARMLAALRPLSGRYSIVGDVRGSGLFIGVELVRDRLTLEPAGDEASFVANRLREEGILLGTDGPHHNVLKIRPPMPFSERDADLLVETLEQIVSEEIAQ